MGSWAEDTFGNDASCDWIDSFMAKPGLEAVATAINVDISTKGYLDSEEACACLAACEVLARLQGKWGVRNAYSEVLDKWIEANPMSVSDGLKAAVDAAINRILAPDSELPELWDDGDRNEIWHAAIDDLRLRVRG